MCCISCKPYQEESVMDTTTVGVDLAKSRFESAVADAEYRIRCRRRLTRAQFAQFFGNHPPSRVVMEACDLAHHWARTLQAQVLPAQYVRTYVKRNKTDAADAGALIEAARCAEIRPVPVKSVEQQTIQQLHRLRAQCMGTRTARINFLRGALREVGVNIPVGARRGIAAVRQALATAQRCGYNKTTVALANKLARIVWATWKYQRPFDGNWAARAGHG